MLTPYYVLKTESYLLNFLEKTFRSLFRAIFVIYEKWLEAAILLDYYFMLFFLEKNKALLIIIMYFNREIHFKYK